MGLGRFLRRTRWDRERQEEIESYIQIETDENIARGMPYDEAVAAARRKFGNATRIREEIYAMNTVAFLDTLTRDVRHGLRMLRHNPTFTSVALLTLAIGIGANTAVFSVVNSVLLKPLDYPKSDQLVALHQLAPGAVGLGNLSDGLSLSPSMYFTYAEHNRSFQSLGVWAQDTANVTGLAQPEQVRIIGVSDGILQTLDIQPAIGRWLSSADQVPDGARNLILSYGYWQRRFAGQRSALGRIIRVDSQPWQIVGVMPRNFRVVDTDFDLLIPLRFDRSKLKLAQFGFNGIGRLKPGVSIPQANGDLSRMLPIWMDSWSNGPGTNPHWYEHWRITPAIRPLKQEVVGSVGKVLWIVMATIALVMLIACANVTNLFLVRADTRQQELAVRAALGAGWSRIVFELLTESLLLGLMGSAFALVLAQECLHFLVAIGPANLPRLAEIALDGSSLAFTLLLAVASSLVCGLVPALKYAGPQVSTALRSAGRTSSVSRERHRTRNLLVVGQVAVALVLLISAGLMIRTFQALRTVDPGFRDGKRLETLRISIPDTLIKEPERVTRVQEQISDKLAAIPGVSSVGFADQMPMEGLGSDWDEMHAENKQANDDAPPLRLFKLVSPGFFGTAGTRLLAGREFTWNDIYGHRPVLILSENLAREWWGTPGAAVGKRMRQFSHSPWREVIGVVQDVRQNGVDEAPPATVYWPALISNYYNSKLYAVPAVTYILRTQRAGTRSLIEEIQQAVWSVEPDLPVASIRTMEVIYIQSLARTSFTLVMLVVTGGMALILGVVGIYGVISYAVSQRRREIGIRLALGAPQQQVRTMFVRSGLMLTAIGGAIGLAIAFGLMRLMKSLLFGISPLDPITYACVTTVLCVAAVLASYLPARRAASINPIEALKAE